MAISAIVALFMLGSVASLSGTVSAALTAPSSAADSSGRRCCTLFGGAFSSDLVAYGVEGTGATAAQLYSSSPRIGIHGSISFSPAHRLSEVYYGSDDIESSLAGALIYFSQATGRLQSVAWDASGCTPSVLAAGQALPAACVGENSSFPTFLETAAADVLLGPWFSSWASPCGHAHLTVNQLTCMPTSITLNATLPFPDGHPSFPLYPGASGRIVLAFANASVAPWSPASFSVPSRCLALMQ